MQNNGLAKNFLYTLLVNLMSILLSTALILILPKFISVEEYGNWQLYLFYLGYVGFFHLGWNDGIYLRYAGHTYEELDKDNLAAQFWGLALLSSAEVLLISGWASVQLSAGVHRNILIIVAFAGLMANLISQVHFVFQTTNRIREYAKVMALEKLLLLIGVISLIITGVNSVYPLIAASISSKLITLIYCMYLSGYTWPQQPRKLFNKRDEIYESIYVGSRLMLANVANILIVGIVRAAIADKWSVGEFGKISLTLSISSLLMVFLTSVSIVIFPAIKRFDPDKAKETYLLLRAALTYIVLGSFTLFYPLKYFLSSWLPAYADSFVYIAILLPICLYESKMVMLLNTYFKVLRQETLLLKINATTLVCSVFATIISVYIYADLTMAVFSILLVLAFRSLCAEYYLHKALQVHLYNRIIVETILVSVFVIVGLTFDNILALVIYSACYIQCMLYGLCVRQLCGDQILL